MNTFHDGCLQKVYSKDARAHPEHDGYSGAQDVQGACNESDNDGGPWVHSGCPRCDGDQTSKGTIAHHAHVIHVLACSRNCAQLSQELKHGIQHG